ncbi:MAG: Phosphatidate cytidylyltransferase [Alphaproteobacteria bacterium MarineAlpha5_Bin5]|nr:MAG: Phosphatidate cytidylyltransferase [Alphaproteobacteria bacterium MarineAlpha5_Bin5]|tara:strand:+ start:70 stop:684 length:615 start_codon:yes stop_codon:yes gene_type:complete
MDYKNFIRRISVSLFFLFIYYIIVYINTDYLTVFGIIIYLAIIYEIIKFFKINLFFILFYLLFSFLFFLIYTNYFFNIVEFNIFIFTIIIFDSFSYLIGTKFGKNKLFIILSPKKTLEGLIGGIFITNILLSIYLYYYEILLENILFINLIILSSFFGDLLQSYFKRSNNLKDSSNFLPGHGGFFDRFDSFIFCIILLFFYQVI